MKKFAKMLSVTAIFLVLVTLCGGCRKVESISCGKVAGTNVTKQQEENENGTTDTITIAEFNAEGMTINYTWVNWYEEGEAELWEMAEHNDRLEEADEHYVPLLKFESKSELDDFITFAKPNFSLEQSYDESQPFAEVVTKYDDDFFEREALLLIYVPEGSGSIRHKVADISMMNTSLTVAIQKNVPEIGTQDMAGWFITIEIQRAAIENCTAFNAYTYAGERNFEYEEAATKEPDGAFVDSQMNFAVELFQRTVAASDAGNVLISPLSVQLALAMTANGADGQTLEEMEAVLSDELTITQLNEYLHGYVAGLPSEEKYKLQIANSIWFRDDARLTVPEEFLQTNADYYGAEIYQSAFDAQTVKDINYWVGQSTDGLIDQIIDEIDDDTVMYLINALVFDAEWQQTYEKSDICNGTFTTANGNERTVEMMMSAEGKYLDDGKATGFIKDYKDGKYSFVALLPNEDGDISEYIAGLDYAELMQTIENVEQTSVMATMPKFSYDYSLSMNNVLKDMGMPTAFDSAAADLSKLGTSPVGNLYIGDVLHKTFISVDELGTQAGAVTKVEIKLESAIMVEKQVRLDRPFVYMIMDNETKLPIFIGAVMDIEE